MRKILGLTIAALLVIGLVGGGTWAYFSDPEDVTGNILTAGTLDLSTGGASAVLTATDMVPGQTIGPATVTLTNSGNIDASSLDIVISYVEDDGTNPAEFTADMTANETAAMLEVTTFTYAGSSILPSDGTNANGWIDVQDLAEADLTGQAGIDGSASEDFVITVQAKGTEMTNDYQADGVDITFTFTLNQ